MPQGACGSVREYDVVCRVGEGTYGEVYRARHLKTAQVYALKKVILHNEAEDGVRAAVVSATCLMSPCIEFRWLFAVPVPTVIAA